MDKYNRYIINLNNGATISIEETDKETAIKEAKKTYEKDFLESNNEFTIVKIS